MQNKLKILIVDNDLDSIELLEYVLTSEGFLVDHASTGVEAIELVKRNNPHLIILDTNIPEMNGFETCEAIRGIPEYSKTKIVFLSALVDDNSKILAFEAGADDYICKPVRPKVLAARLGAILKEFKTAQLLNTVSDTFKIVGNITIDYEKYLVYVGQKEVNLPKKEFQLLNLLTSKPSKVFTRQEIFDHIWVDGDYVNSRFIDVHIHNLRENIGPDRIKTIKGVGYKFI